MEKVFDKYTLEYKPVDEGASLTSISFPNEIKELILPDEIDGKKIVEIGENFIFRKSGPIESLVLPKYLKRIDKQGLRRMYHLKKVEIPASVEIIEEKALEGCESLVELTFEKGSKLKSIGTSAFEKCLRLKEIYLPEGLEVIGEDAFYGCANMNYSLRVHVPSTLKKCGENSFSQYSGYGGRMYDEITIVYSAYSHANGSVTFSEKINKIEMEYDETITVDKSEYSLDPSGAMLKKLFVNVNKIIIPQKITYKGKDYPVYGVMPNAVETEQELFEEIVIPEGIVFIGTNAFNVNKVAKPVFLPDSVKFIDEHAFNGNIPFIHVPYIDKEKFEFSCTSFIIYENEVDVKKDGIYIMGGIKREDIRNNDDFYYVIKNKKVGLIRYIGKDENFYIPNTIDGLPVTMIAGLCYFHIKYVNEVKIPKNVEYVYGDFLPKEYGSISFEEGSHLKYFDRDSIRSGHANSFVLPDSLEFIDHSFHSRFGSWGSYYNLTVPHFKRLKYLSYLALTDPSVKSLYLPKTIYFVNYSAISYNTIEEITFEDGSEPIYFHFNSNVYKNRRLKFNKYKGGFYLGSKSNPYLLLVYIDDVGNPIIEVHPDTILISDMAFGHTANAIRITFGDKVKAIWSTLPSYAKPVINKWPASLKYINKEFVDRINKDKSSPLPDTVEIIQRPGDNASKMFLKRERWYQDE